MASLARVDPLRRVAASADDDANHDANHDARDGDAGPRSTLEGEAREETYARSPCEDLARLTLAALLSVVQAACACALCALYAVRAVTPAPVERFTRARAFDVAYAVYASALGRAAHRGAVSMTRGGGTHSTAHPPMACGGKSVIVSVPFMNDNYSYVVVDSETREACAIDPADPEATLECAKKIGARLTTVLTTHKHHDHAGGNGRLVAMMAEEENGAVAMKVYGHARDGCHGVNARVEHGDVVRVGRGTRFLVTHVPCHTRGHVVYGLLGQEYEDDGETAPSLADVKAMFTGDAIINGGVGAFFHGDAKDCYENLHERLADVSDDCLVFSGHEYMETNLRFAKAIDVADEITANCFFAILLHRHKRASTMPSSFRVERRLNPFFRCRDREYLRTLVETKKEFAKAKQRPWWHRYFGPDAKTLAERREREVENGALARLLASANHELAATKEEAVAGMNMVINLMSDVFAVIDARNGDDEERRVFVQYAKHAAASGHTRVVVSQLIAPGLV